MDSNLEEHYGLNEEERPLSIDTADQAEIGNRNLSIHSAEELNNASFVSSHSNQSITHESQTSGSSQNVCAFCGREHAEIKPLQVIGDAYFTAVSSSHSLLAPILPSQETEKQRKQEEATQMFEKTTEEEASEWIFCDVCRKWYHALCMNIQQYELPLIDKFHCSKCQPEYGPSKMKVKRIFHRHAFDDESEREMPVQIGTESWTKKFKEIYEQIPEVPSPDVIQIFENGHELMENFNFGHCWMQPMKVINQTGLGLKMPKDPEFDVLDVIKLLGGHVLVDTIDVFAQQSYTMSLHNFYQLWKSQPRERLYNILSLEFSETKLSEIVQSPSLVRQLSWVQRFWPNVNKGESDDIYSFSENPNCHSVRNQQQQENAQPYVEHFCLMGMKGSYTDFHIDFGGSSVWYHVFKGEKVFFIAQPNSQNLEAFLRWQKDKHRSEQFFGDLLPPGEKLYRLHVHERETLFLPSGWIHSVYTPKDSLVFGGNFLHTLNVPMQIKIYEMEIVVDIEERFKFPYFELCNFYAAKNIAEHLKDFTFENKIVEQVILDAAVALVSKCTYWVRGGPHKKFYMFNGTLKLLEKELYRQQNLQRRFSEKLPNLNTKSSTQALINDDSKLIDSKTKPKLEQKMDTQDLDSSWDEVEEEEEDEMMEERADEGKKKKKKHNNRLVRIKRRRQTVSNVGNSNDDKSARQDQQQMHLEIESSGPIKLKIKLPMQVPCWRSHQQSQSPSTSFNTGKKNMSNAIKEEDDEEVDVSTLFKGKSAHGRRLRLTSRITNLFDADCSPATKTSNILLDAFSSPDDQKRASDANDSDFNPAGDCRRTSTAGHKNFMAQFSAEERKRIELAEKAGEMDSRGTLFSPFQRNILEQKKKKRTSQQQKTKEKADSLMVEGSSSNSHPKPTHESASQFPIEKKVKKTATLSARQSLAKKLGLTRKK